MKAQAYEYEIRYSVPENSDTRWEEYQRIPLVHEVVRQAVECELRDADGPSKRERLRAILDGEHADTLVVPAGLVLGGGFDKDLFDQTAPDSIDLRKIPLSERRRP